MAEITLIGNLGSDAELTTTPNGKAKLEFSVGDTPRRLNQQTNQWEDAGETTWWRVTEWEDKAVALAGLLAKGSRVLVIGTGGVRTYDKTDGSKGFSAEIRPKHIALFPKAGAPVNHGSWTPPQQQAPAEDPWATPTPANNGWGNQPTDAPF